MSAFTSMGSKNLSFILILIFFYFPGGNVYPVDDVAIYFVSGISVISLYVYSNLKTMSSRSLYSAILTLQLSGSYEYQGHINYILCVLFLIAFLFPQLLLHVNQYRFEILSLIILVVWY